MTPRKFWEAAEAIKTAEEAGLECLDQKDFDALMEAAKGLYAALLNALLTKHCKEVLETEDLDVEEEDGSP